MDLKMSFIWRKINLQTRILLIVAMLTLITIGGGLVMLYYSYQTNLFFREVVDENLAALQASDRLETSLVMQKGYLTYFFLDGDDKWLRELRTHQEGFENWLDKARNCSRTDDERRLLNQIEADYMRLTALREQTIRLYKSGKKQEGYEIHQRARSNFHDITEQARLFRKNHEKDISEARREIAVRAGYTVGLVLVVLPLALVLASLLTYILVRQVLGPIQSLAREAKAAEENVDYNVVQALSDGVHSLIYDVDKTRSELEASRMRLMQAAKMASVGKLAASVAHSIRNPLTSVKMRLFSLDRTLELSPAQREDFSVISEEIRHIDNVLRNFLEFSRRPKLQFQYISPTEVVDTALDLVNPRLESCGVEVIDKRKGRLPKIQADPAQLKEALVNLLVNSVEAMGRGGEIIIEESEEKDAIMGRVVCISLTDSGSGVPEPLRDQVFQLFFSTKDQGTGLGLSIATRIIEEHGGGLTLEPQSGQGATFTLRLPVTEGLTWERS